jgi:GNAT superfamily N-acetyltransferase
VTRWSWGFDADLAATYARRICSDPVAVGSGAFDGAALVGFITGICGATLPFTRSVVAIQHLLYVTPPHRRQWLAGKLVWSFIDEARARGARDITMSTGTGCEPEAVGKLFEICRLAHVGGIYVMEA